MTNELQWRHERPEWSSSATVVNKLQSPFFLSSFSHPVDPQSNTKKEEKVKRSPSQFGNITVEAAETDYQRRDYAASVS